VSSRWHRFESLYATQSSARRRDRFYVCVNHATNFFSGRNIVKKICRFICGRQQLATKAGRGWNAGAESAANPWNRVRKYCRCNTKPQRPWHRTTTVHGPPQSRAEKKPKDASSASKLRGSVRGENWLEKEKRLARKLAPFVRGEIVIHRHLFTEGKRLGKLFFLGKITVFWAE